MSLGKFTARVYSILIVAGLAAGLLGSAVAVTPAHAFNIILVDTTDGGLNNSDGDCSLYEAIANANNDDGFYSECGAGAGADTIMFSDALGTAAITLAATLPIMSDADGLTILGGGDIAIDGADARQVFQVGYSPVTLRDLTVTHGLSTDGGGAYVGNGSLTILGSTFSDNNAIAPGSIIDGGGAIAVSLGTLTIEDSTFTGNHTSNEGGAIYTYGSAVTITNSTFASNSASGGGAGSYGGGLYSYADLGQDITIINSTFSGNTSDSGSGAAIHLRIGGSLTLHNSILANSITGGDCFSPASETGANNLFETGAMACSFSDGVNGNIVGVDPSLGSLTGSPGYFPLDPGSWAIDAGNNSFVPGGLITDQPGNARFSDDPFTADTGVGTPPIVDIGSFEVQFTCPGSHVYVDDNASGADDGTSWADAFNDLQDGLTVAAACPGIDVLAAEGVYKPDGADPGNRGLSFQMPPDVAVYGGYPNGGGTRDWNAHATILSGDVDNDDVNVDGNNIAETWSHIASYNSYHVVVMDGTGTAVDSDTVLDGFIITGGKADGSSVNSEGAGLLCDARLSGSVCSPHLENLTFSGNYAGYGAAIMNDNFGQGTNDPTLTDVTFSGNFAYSNGGALFNYGASPVLTNVTFSDNAAGGLGGAIINAASSSNSSPTLLKVVFTGNDADQGGAMANFAYSSTGVASPILTDVTFDANIASSIGGAMYNYAVVNTVASPTITRATFQNNHADGGGGAMYNYANGGNASPSLGNVTFYNNSSINGGAIYNNGTAGSASPALNNVTFNSNDATGYGGGMFNITGGGTSTPALANVILWDDTAFSGGPEIENDGGVPTISYSVVEGGCGSIPDASCGSGNLSTDPMLDALGDNSGFTETMALLTGSSAIDTGHDATCAAGAVNGEDQRGVPRPQGPHCDIGAYEAADEPLILRIYPPQSSTVCRKPFVGVHLKLGPQVRTGAGLFDPTTVTLKLDGAAYTSQAVIYTTVSDPVTHATLLYVPPSNLATGSHTAQFIYPNYLGTQTKTWTFTASSIACGTTPLNAPMQPTTSPASSGGSRSSMLGGAQPAPQSSAATLSAANEASPDEQALSSAPSPDASSPASAPALAPAAPDLPVIVQAAPIMHMRGMPHPGLYWVLNLLR